MTDQDGPAAHEGRWDEPASPAQGPEEPAGAPQGKLPPHGPTGTRRPAREYRPVRRGDASSTSRTYRPAQQPRPWPGEPQRPGGRQPGAWQPGWQQPGPLPQPLGTQRLAGPPLWGWRESVLGLLVGFAPEALLALAAYATGTATNSSQTEVSVGTGIVLVVSSLVFYGWQLFAAWLFGLRRAARALLALGFRRPALSYFWVVPLVLVATYAVLIANDSVLHPPQQDIVESFPKTAAGIVLFTLLAVVMAPLAEEAFFRGFLFRGLANSWGFLPGATVSAAVFSAAHLQLTIFVPLFVLGFGFAWAYKRTGSLWTNITIHAVFNGISVLAWALSS